MDNTTYEQVKNIIHNDLGISKEYIDNIIITTVKNEVNKIINDEQFIRSLIEKQILNGLTKEDRKLWHTLYDTTALIRDEVNCTIVEMVKNKLEIRLKNDCDGNYNINDFEPVKDKLSGHFRVKRKDD